MKNISYYCEKESFFFSTGPTTKIIALGAKGGTIKRVCLQDLSFLWCVDIIVSSLFNFERGIAQRGLRNDDN